jgi:polypeptide N-acetylgalactosaminyltransferase
VLEKYPPLPPNKHWGELKSEASGACLDTFGRHPPEAAGASGCHGYGGNQLLRLNTQGQMTSGEWCIKAESSDQVLVAWCEMVSARAAITVLGKCRGSGSGAFPFFIKVLRKLK